MDLDQAVDELYGAALEDFVGERSRLAKVLKAAGQADDAARLAKMRKPTVAAWCLNQLARTNRREIDLLLDAGHRLREAQAALLGGSDRQVLTRAQTAERDIVGRLTRAAKQLLADGSASANVLGQVAESLRTAAISSDGRELLARGRFTRPPTSPGFDLATELAEQTPRPTTGRGRTRPTGDRTKHEAAREALRVAKAELQAAEQRAREARREAVRLANEAQRAAARATAADKSVDAAEAAVAEAQKRLRS